MGALDRKSLYITDYHRGYFLPPFPFGAPCLPSLANRYKMFYSVDSIRPRSDFSADFDGADPSYVDDLANEHTDEGEARLHLSDRRARSHLSDRHAIVPP